jgi:hypothetical protein
MVLTERSETPFLIGITAFLGKNQIPDKRAEPIYIPALPQDSDSVSLCPVRILSIYWTRTASLRSSTNKRLVIPADSTSLSDALLNNAREDTIALTS